MATELKVSNKDSLKKPRNQFKYSENWCEEYNKPLLLSQEGLNKRDIDINGFKSFCVLNSIDIDPYSRVPPTGREIMVLTVPWSEVASLFA